MATTRNPESRKAGMSGVAPSLPRLSLVSSGERLEPVALGIGVEDASLLAGVVDVCKAIYVSWTCSATAVLGLDLND